MFFMTPSDFKLQHESGVNSRGCRHGGQCPHCRPSRVDPMMAIIVAVTTLTFILRSSQLRSSISSRRMNYFTGVTYSQVLDRSAMEIFWMTFGGRTVELSSANACRTKKRASKTEFRSTPADARLNAPARRLATFFLKATSGTRTLDPSFTKAVLYQLS